MTETRQGKFIVIEGTDGSGKTEQFNRLVLRLPGHFRVQTVDFPQYGKPSAYFVEKYLKGLYGSLGEIGPRAASIFFALDRFDVGYKIKAWLDEGRIVVGNRYAGSNMGHQGAKTENKKERHELFRWLYELEYETLHIPKPDLNIILHVPAEISYELIEKKASREYLGGGNRDIHEASIEHLRRAEQTYLEIAELYPKDFVLVECAPNGKLLSIEAIHEKVWVVAAKLLGV